MRPENKISWFKKGQPRCVPQDERIQSFCDYFSNNLPSFHFILFSISFQSYLEQSSHIPLHILCYYFLNNDLEQSSPFSLHTFCNYYLDNYLQQSSLVPLHFNMHLLTYLFDRRTCLGKGKGIFSDRRAGRKASKYLHA